MTSADKLFDQAHELLDDIRSVVNLHEGHLESEDEQQGYIQSLRLRFRQFDELYNQIQRHSLFPSPPQKSQ
jgi:hypothetical protein